MTNENDLIKDAFMHHQSGDFETATLSYKKILKNMPDHVDANFLLGTLDLQQGNLDQAARSLKKAITLAPKHLQAHNNLGTVFQKQGRYDEAVSCFNRAIELKPENQEAHFNLGNVLRKQGKLEEAIISYKQSLVLAPHDFEVYNSLGSTLRENGKLEEAVMVYRKLITHKPNNAVPYNSLGTVLQESGKPEEAILFYKQAIKINPDYAMAYSNLGAAFHELGRLDNAILNYSKAIKINPDYSEALNSLGSALQVQGKNEEAIQYYKQAIKAGPDNATAHNNLGTSLQELDKLQEALGSYNHAIALNSEDPESHKNRAMILLLKENFSDGWDEYEWRLRTKRHGLRTFNKPKWDGTALNNRHVLVHAEQGFGDTIQFIRYLPLVRARGGYVVFECHKHLTRLLKNCAGIDEIIERKGALGPSVKFDVHIPLLSLPGIFRTKLDTIPSIIPYISVDSDIETQWDMLLEQNQTFKIGIVWAGNPSFKNYYNRSCSLSDFAPLANIPGVVFFSLQKGPVSIEISKPPKGMKIYNMSDRLNDFADTAALMQKLDLIISTDTGVVHLAGAIGKPVWTLLHFIPDWRWFLGRDDSPWYPGMRLFRQKKPGDWEDVFDRVKKALSETVHI